MPVSTLFYLPPPPGAGFLEALAVRVEDFLATGKPPYPAERGLFDVAQHPDNYIGALRRAGGQGRDEAGDADNNDRSLVVLGGEEIQTLKHDDPAAENRRRVAPLHCFRVN